MLSAADDRVPALAGDSRTPRSVHRPRRSSRNIQALTSSDIVAKTTADVSVVLIAYPDFTRTERDVGPRSDVSTIHLSKSNLCWRSKRFEHRETLWSVSIRHPAAFATGIRPPFSAKGCSGPNHRVRYCNSTQSHWSRWDSNPRPPGCKPGALPTELRPPSRIVGGRETLSRNSDWGLSRLCRSSGKRAESRPAPRFQFRSTASSWHPNWARQESNLRLRRYQRRALTN